MKMIILLFFLNSLIINGNNTNSILDKQDESALQKGDKIEELYQLCLKKSGDSTVFPYIDQLQREAEKANNSMMEARCMALRIQSFANQNKIDSVMKYAETTLETLRAEKDYKSMFATYNIIVGQLIFNQNYTQSLQWINRQYKEAKELDNQMGLAMANKNFGMVYQYTGRFTEASKFYGESMELLRKSNNVFLMGDLYLDMILVDRELNNYESALLNCDRCFALLEELSKDKNNKNYNALHGQYFTCYCFKAYIYLALDRIQEAKECIDQAVKMVDPLWTGIWLTPLRDAQIKYNICIGNYEQALKYYNLQIEESMPGSSLKSRYYLSNFKAEIEMGMGNYKEACQIYRNQTRLSDSISNINIAKQLDEIRSLYEIDKLEMENHIHMVFMSVSIIILVIVCLFLGVILFIIQRNSRIQKEKNRNLFLQLQDKDRLQAEIKRLSMFIKDVKVSKELNTESSLFDRLQSWMEETKSYINPNMQQKEVASALSTNTRYLCNAIKDNVGQTFNEYVNSFRLEYARELLLSANLHHMTVESISAKAGFGTRSNFYRLFRLKYGLTPLEFKKQSEEVYYSEYTLKNTEQESLSDN